MGRWDGFLSKLFLWPPILWCLCNLLSHSFVLSQALQRWQMLSPLAFPTQAEGGGLDSPHLSLHIWLRCLNQDPGPLCSAERQASPKGCSNGSSVLAAWALFLCSFSLDRGVFLCLYFSWLLAELLVGWSCLILHLLSHTYLQLWCLSPWLEGILMEVCMCGKMQTIKKQKTLLAMWCLSWESFKLCQGVRIFKVYTLTWGKGKRKQRL